MADQAALNSIVTKNLADLEASCRQIEEVVTPLIQDELLRLAAEFLDANTVWTGEAEHVDDLWLAPKAWRDGGGGGGGGEHEYLGYFKLRTTAGREAVDDAFWLSALIGAGARKLGLFVVSDRLDDVPLGERFAAEAELVQRLQQVGFVYDIAQRRARYLPVALDREQLVADLRADELDAALTPIRTAMEAVKASVPLLEPLVATIRAQA